MKFTALLAGCLLALPSSLMASTVSASEVDLTGSSSSQRLTISTDGDANNYTWGIEGRDLERRQSAGSIANDVIYMLNEAAGYVNNQGGSNDERRARFTREVVARGRDRYNGYNWVLCSTRHSAWWDGQQGVDWDWRPYTFGNAKYDVNWAKSGTFQRMGDGGYLNWAWAGKTSYKSPNGDLIVFRAP